MGRWGRVFRVSESWKAKQLQPFPFCHSSSPPPPPRLFPPGRLYHDILTRARLLIMGGFISAPLHDHFPHMFPSAYSVLLVTSVPLVHSQLPSAIPGLPSNHRLAPPRVNLDA